MKYKTFLALLAVASLPFPNAAYSETLKETVGHALAFHPSVETALAGKVIAKEDKNEARSDFFPVFSANLSAGRVFGDNSTSRGLTVDRGSAYSYLGEGSAALTQPIFDGMETKNRVEAAQARFESADYSVVDARENLALRAVQAHLNVMRAQETIDKIYAYQKSIDDYLERITLMVDEGVADTSEAAQARNVSLMLQGTLIDFEGQLTAAHAAYKEIVGAMPKSDLVKPQLAENEIQTDVEQALQKAKREHPLVQIDNKNLEAAGFDVKAEGGTLYPYLDGELSYLNRDQDEEIGGEVIDARALLKLSWDLETGGAQIARKRRAKAQYSEILSQSRETIQTMEADIRRSYAEYETAKKQRELMHLRQEVTQELMEAYETQFEGARVRLLQLMQAESQLFNAQVEAISAEYRYLMSQYMVMASMGRLLSEISSHSPDNNVRVSNIEIKKAENKNIEAVSGALEEKISGMTK